MIASLSKLRFLFVAVDVSSPAEASPGWSDRRARTRSLARSHNARFRAHGATTAKSTGRGLDLYGSGITGNASRPGAARRDVLQGCVDDASFDAGYGNCSTYATGGENEGFCSDDDACEACGCACVIDCVTADGGGGGAGGSGVSEGCKDEASFDAGYGNCSSYAVGGENEGYCKDDGGCDSCSCSCAIECAEGVFMCVCVPPCVSIFSPPPLLSPPHPRHRLHELFAVAVCAFHI